MATSAIPVESLQLIYTVQHPCHVVNFDRAIETLGGRPHLIDVFTHASTSQLTCSFTPSNIYERPLRGDRQKSIGLLIRVRRTKHTKSVQSVHVIGVLDTSYSFESLADFQYLPMIRKGDQYESFLNRVSLNRQCLDKENLERPCPLMCIPAIFSRFFDPTDYAFRPEPKARPKRAATTITRAKQAVNSNKLTKRNVRASSAHHIGFDAVGVPTGNESSTIEPTRPLLPFRSKICQRSVHECRSIDHRASPSFVRTASDLDTKQFTLSLENHRSDSEAYYSSRGLFLLQRSVESLLGEIWLRSTFGYEIESLPDCRLSCTCHP